MNISSSNPLIYILNVIGLVLFLIISATLGFVLLAIGLGLVALFASYLGFTRWRLRRKAEKNPNGQTPGSVIEGEYRVVRDSKDSE